MGGLSKYRLPLTLGLGQLISALIAGTGVFSTLLGEAGAQSAAMQAFLAYAALAVVFVPLRVLRDGWWCQPCARPRAAAPKSAAAFVPLRVALWKYMLMSVL